MPVRIARSSAATIACGRDLPVARIRMIRRMRCAVLGSISAPVQEVPAMKCIAMAGCSRDGSQMRKICRRSEEHTSELQSLIRISYAVFCLKKKKTKTSRCKLELKQSNTKQQTFSNQRLLRQKIVNILF